MVVRNFEHVCVCVRQIYINLDGSIVYVCIPSRASLEYQHLWVVLTPNFKTLPAVSCSFLKYVCFLCYYRNSVFFLNLDDIPLDTFTCAVPIIFLAECRRVVVYINKNMSSPFPHPSVSPPSRSVSTTWLCSAGRLVVRLQEWKWDAWWHCVKEQQIEH